MTVVASNWKRELNELYQTEPWAVRALLRKLPISSGTIWESSAGNHKIADVLLTEGFATITSDVTEYERKHSFLYNFTAELQTPAIVCDGLITNPPYGAGNRQAAAYARIALVKCSGWIALLLTAKFDFGKTRADLFANNTRFWGKLCLVDRIQWFPDGGYATGTEDHAWYIWKPKEYEQDQKRPYLMYGGKE